PVPSAQDFVPRQGSSVGSTLIAAMYQASYPKGSAQVPPTKIILNIASCLGVVKPEMWKKVAVDSLKARLGADFPVCGLKLVALRILLRRKLSVRCLAI